jgi:hypothetical protein
LRAPLRGALGFFLALPLRLAAAIRSPFARSESDRDQLSPDPSCGSSSRSLQRQLA